MGILDDAIREHLELKRRRGADPNELERLEREALGPVRRGPHEALDVPVAGETLDQAGYVDEQPAAAWRGPEDELSSTDEGAEFPRVDETGEWEEPERGPIQGAIPVEPDIAAPAPPAPPAPAEEPIVPPHRSEPPPAGGPLDASDYLEQETVEHEVEGEYVEEPEQDDMLEETPEFLQDTPDHDRLWFEQRPPRDFDFDG